MILLTGGFAQGQADYAARVYPDRICIPDVQDMVKHDTDGAAFAHELAEAHPDGVLICNEVGCGVVPLDKDERRRREEIGRCLRVLAAEADEVIRVCCGLGMKLK